MIIYPAIDIKNGKCVRLLQGRAQDETVYHDDPVAVAEQWARLGAQWLHIVDLDGAFTGESINLGIVKQIIRQVGLHVQLGGGIRSIEAVDARIAAGVARVILGTIAIEQPQIARECAQKYPGSIAVGIDVRDGRVATRGWMETTQVQPVALACQARDIGIQTVIYTDISRDGMLTGPNCAAVKQMVQKTGMNIIASGGFSCIEDIQNIASTGAAGIILGKSLYTGSIDLAKALAIAGSYQVAFKTSTINKQKF